MSFTTSSQRQKTMLARIGDAAELVDDRRFLPFYRGVQIKLEKMGKADEWGRMIAAAKEASNPSRYFAKLCKKVRDGTYIFIQKAKKVAGDMAAHISDRISKFGFGRWQKYWVRKCNEYINLNSMAGFVELLEYSERKGVSQQYFARAILNGKSPRNYYRENVIGGAK